MKNDGGSAFPGIIENQKFIEHNGISHPVGEKEKIYIRGMSLRQWYAGLAMLGMMTNANTTHDLAEFKKCYDETARHAFKFSDAMIEVEKEGEK